MCVVTSSVITCNWLCGARGPLRYCSRVVHKCNVSRARVRGYYCFTARRVCVCLLRVAVLRKLFCVQTRAQRSCARRNMLHSCAPTDTNTHTLAYIDFCYIRRRRRGLVVRSSRAEFVSTCCARSRCCCRSNRQAHI